MPVEFLMVAGMSYAAATVTAFVIKTIASFAISALLSPKQKSQAAAPLADAAQTQTLTLTQPAPDWEVVYGQVRKGGKYVFRHVTQVLESQTHTERHNVPTSAPYTITLINGASLTNLAQVDEEEVQFIDDARTLNYTPFVAAGGAPAVGEYSISGGVLTFNAADAGRTMRVIYTADSGPVKWKFLHLVIALAAHECEEIGDVYLDDELVPLDGNGYATTSTRFAGGYVYVSKHLGTADQTVDTLLNTHAPDKWTAEHRLRGHAYIYVRLIKHPDIFPGGVPNISVVMKGKKVYDPRSGLTAWSDNAALCLADYMASATYGLAAPYTTGIDDAELIAAANVCDEAVALAAGGTEARYTCNGVISTADQPKEIIGRMLGAMAGRAVYVSGVWKLKAGAYVAPTLTFDEGDFSGAVHVSTRLSRRDMFNAVKGTYISPANKWQVADFPALASATYLSEDNGERIWKDIELPFTTSASMAQRLAKIELLRSRQQITVQAPMKLSAYKAEPPDTVALTFGKFGWSAKSFDISQMRMTFAEAPVVELSLRETASTVYDWSTSEESAVDDAPNTNLPSPFVVESPGTPVITETLYEVFGSGVKTKALVSWAAPLDAQALRFDLQYQKRGAITWNEQSGLSSTVAEVLEVEADDYLFRVRAINALGVASLWAQAEKTFVGLTAAPADVAGFSLIKTSGFALAQWSMATDIDVRVGGSVVIRHSPLTSGATWENGVILNTFPGAAIQGTVPLITGTYMAKFRDSQGNYSASEATFVGTEGMVTGFTTTATSTQATAFSGTKTNVVRDSTMVALKLDSTTLIDSMVTSVDAWPYIDGIGGVSATGSYAFDTHVDMTTVATRRFEADITALSYDTADFIDFRLDAIDDWDSFDGDTINDCDVTLYASTTDDNPAGSPVWGAWTPFFVADFTCRAARFKLDFISGASTHNIAVSQLTVHVKTPA